MLSYFWKTFYIISKLQKWEYLYSSSLQNDIMGKCPISSQKAQTDLLSLHVLSHTDSFHREGAEKKNAETCLCGNTNPGRLERMEKYKLSSKKQICFFYIWFKKSKLKKKKNRWGLRRRKESGKWALWKFLWRTNWNLLILTQGTSTLGCIWRFMGWLLGTLLSMVLFEC